MALRLNETLSVLLNEVLSKRNPQMTSIVASSPDAELTEDQREELRQIITDEFIETGLREDDEPNARGLLLEELIDELGYL